ncbi:MAG: glycosyltransferase [Pyrinomonadaceae bacterium]|nr:glycosyltransferase [Pyrinomonadaceae bacterium]
MKKSNHLILSVVIIGRNEGSRLVRCLESVKAMNFPGEEVEIIYVDSASTDDSAEVATRFGAKVISVKPERPTAALGRNAGWRAAKAPFILFLDGDTILEPDFVNKALNEFVNPFVAVVFGHRREIYPNSSIYNRVLDLDWISPIGNAQYCGGDALIRREILEKVQGYNENLIAGEEPEMCSRMRMEGFVISHIDALMTEHDLAIKHFSQYWRRATRTGYAYAEISNRLSQTEIPLWKEDVRRNISRTLILSFLFLASIIGGILFFSLIPLIVFLTFFLVMSFRSAYKMRWKTDDLYTLLLYGFHSQLQHFPIFVGQLQFYRDKNTTNRRGLIEYKEA